MLSVKLYAHKSDIRLGNNDMLKGILEVCFPKRGTRMFTDEVHNGVEALIMDGDKRGVYAIIDRWQA